MEQGWIYVLVNSSIPGMAKVGRTTREPLRRVAELSAATGVATPFVIAFEQAFDDCEQAEHAVHDALDRRGLRVAPNREFFRGPVTDIARLVIDVAAQISLAPASPARAAPTHLRAHGDQWRLGEGDLFQDRMEALRCYRLAARAGDLRAFERLASVHLEMDDRGRPGRQALLALKEGFERGNYYCIAEMASLYASQGHMANCFKAWQLFFSRRAAGWRADLEGPSPTGGQTGASRFAVACQRYIATCMAQGWVPKHLTDMRTEADAILALQLAEQHRLSDDAANWKLLASTLHWTYLALVEPSPGGGVSPRRAARRSPRPRAATCFGPMGAAA